LVYLFVCLVVCLFVCLFVCLLACLFACFFVCVCCGMFLQKPAACVLVYNLYYFDLKYTEIEPTDSYPWPRLAAGFGGDACPAAARGAVLAVWGFVATCASVRSSQEHRCEASSSDVAATVVSAVFSCCACLDTYHPFVVAAFSGAGCLGWPP
jgi:hypothetical protein